MSNRDYVLRAAQQQMITTICMMEESIGISETAPVNLLLVRTIQEIDKMLPPRTFVAGGATPKIDIMEALRASLAEAKVAKAEQRKAAGGAR